MADEKLMQTEVDEIVDEALEGGENDPITADTADEALFEVMDKVVEEQDAE